MGTDRAAVESTVVFLNPSPNGTMATSINSAIVNAQVSLTSFTLCQIRAAVPNVVPGSQIRPVSRSGTLKLKTIIKRDGFAKHSFLYVVETPVASIDPLHVIVQKYHKTGFIPDGTSVCADGDDGYVILTEPPNIKALRRFWTLDGGHRLKAMTDLYTEATTKGDKVEAARFGSVPVIVLYGMTKSQMSVLAAKLNTANGSDFVKTTNLHKYTVLRKQVQYYVEEEVERLRGIMKNSTEAKDSEGAKATCAQIKKLEEGDVVVSDFCEHQDQQLQKFGQTMLGVYGINMKNFGLYVGVALRFSPALALKVQAMYDDEVLLDYT